MVTYKCYLFRFTPEAFDWLFEQEKESVDLLKWLSKTLSADTYLSEDQLESYNQIPSRQGYFHDTVL